MLELKIILASEEQFIVQVATPPGDEIWAQKCHELDFQVRFRLFTCQVHHCAIFFSYK
jgi:hypothetical protein